MSIAERVRTSPRISVAKLGEYLTATPRRRRAIIRAQHKPSDSIIARSHDARSAVVRFLTNQIGEEGLMAERERIRAVSTGSEWARNDRRLSADAVDRFLDIADRVVVGDRPRSGTDVPNSIEIARVRLSVRPDVIFMETKDSATRHGCIKLVFTRAVPISSDVGAYIGTALAEAAETIGEGVLRGEVHRLPVWRG